MEVSNKHCISWPPRKIIVSSCYSGTGTFEASLWQIVATLQHKIHHHVMPDNFMVYSNTEILEPTWIESGPTAEQTGIAKPQATDWAMAGRVCCLLGR